MAILGTLGLIKGQLRATDSTKYTEDNFVIGQLPLTKESGGITPYTLPTLVGNTGNPDNVGVIFGGGYRTYNPETYISTRTLTQDPMMGMWETCGTGLSFTDFFVQLTNMKIYLGNVGPAINEVRLFASAPYESSLGLVQSFSNLDSSKGYVELQISDEVKQRYFSKFGVNLYFVGQDNWDPNESHQVSYGNIQVSLNKVPLEMAEFPEGITYDSVKNQVGVHKGDYPNSLGDGVFTVTQNTYVPFKDGYRVSNTMYASSGGRGEIYLYKDYNSKIDIIPVEEQQLPNFEVEVVSAVKIGTYTKIVDTGYYQTLQGITFTWVG